jgi:hypothetical protein
MLFVCEKLTSRYKFRKFEEKTYFFGFSTMVQNSLKIQEKFKKIFFGFLLVLWIEGATPIQPTATRGIFFFNPSNYISTQKPADL